MSIFSLPFSPYIKQSEYEEVYLPFVQEYKKYIYDIYTTIRISPFKNDAMGGVLDSKKLIKQALKLQLDSKIPVSATFNDITVAPSEKNLDIFIESFKPLYDQGITFITMPVMHWMLSGKLFSQFPLLKIKNSVLNCVDNAQNYWDASLAGYAVINIDRRLLRDFKTLKEIKKAQNLFKDKFGYAPLTQILANEHCIGLCPVMKEHYTKNILTGSYDINYTCKSWKTNDEAYSYRVANISPYYDDIKETLKYIDILKLHGRGGTALLQESMQIIGDYSKKKELFHLGSELFENKKEEDIKQWRKTIKNCRFQCWNCDVCDRFIAKV